MYQVENMESPMKPVMKENKIIFESPMKNIEDNFEVNVHLPQENPNDEAYPVQYQSFVISELPELMNFVPELQVRQDSEEAKS